MYFSDLSFSTDCLNLLLVLAALPGFALNLSLKLCFKTSLKYSFNIFVAFGICGVTQIYF